MTRTAPVLVLMHEVMSPVVLDGIAAIARPPPATRAETVAPATSAAAVRLLGRAGRKPTCFSSGWAAPGRAARNSVRRAGPSGVTHATSSGVLGTPENVADDY